MRRLLFTFVRIGDLVMMTPLLRRLAADGPLELVARPWAAGLLADQPWIAAVHGLETPHKGASWVGGLIWGGPRRRLRRRLPARGYDEVVVFARESPAARALAEGIAAAAGARVRELRLSLREPGHVVDRLPAALDQAGIPSAGMEREPRLDVPAERLAAGRARLAALAGGRRAVLIQAGSSLTDRRFRPRPNLKGLTDGQWARLIRRLLAADPDRAVVLLGSDNEAAAAEAIRREAGDERVRVGVGVPLRDLPGVFAAAEAAISVDTGPGHVAAAVGCPLLSIFGPTDPGIYRPRGPGRTAVLLGSAPCQFCHGTPAWDACARNRCLAELTDDAIWAAWTRLGAQGSP